MSLFKQKEPPIKDQPPWLITIYSEVQNEGDPDEFDPGFIEFEHKQTGISLKYEMSWLKSHGPTFEDKNPPTLIDIWEILLKYTPGFKVIIHKNWHIRKDVGCFIYQLADREKQEYVIKRILSNHTCQDQDFFSFIRMLDNEQEYYDSNTKSTILNLNNEREKRNKVVNPDHYVDYGSR